MAGRVPPLVTIAEVISREHPDVRVDLLDAIDAWKQRYHDRFGLQPTIEDESRHKSRFRRLDLLGEMLADPRRAVLSETPPVGEVAVTGSAEVLSDPVQASVSLNTVPVPASSPTMRRLAREALQHAREARP